MTDLQALLLSLREGEDGEAIRAAAKLIEALLPGSDAREAAALLLNLAAKVQAHAGFCRDW